MRITLPTQQAYGETHEFFIHWSSVYNSLQTGNHKAPGYVLGKDTLDNNFK